MVESGENRELESFDVIVVCWVLHIQLQFKVLVWMSDYRVSIDCFQEIVKFEQGVLSD